jgi:hypothetical protein
MTEQQAPYGNGKEIVVIPNQSLADITDDIIASAERRVASVEKIISLALKITNTQDWVDQNGKPYLVGSGAEKIARLFGVCWSNIKTEKVMTNDENGPFYFYQTSGVFSLRDDKVEAVGTCSSKDQFFAIRQGVLQPLSKVDETNIMKASYTNCVTNGITRLLGLRNLTWEQVSRSGISQDKVAGVKYASGGQGGGKISEAQAKRLFAITMSGSDTDLDRNARAEELKKHLKEKYHVEHSKDIDRKDYEAIVAWAQKLAEERTVGA